MPESNPLCTVVIPAFQCGKYIRQCVQSVCEQTVDALEILVIDDKSTDNTPAIVTQMAKDDPRIRYVRLNKNKGVADVRNMGVEQARGEWIAFLDSDDAWKPDKLEKQLQHHKDTGAELIYTAARCMDEDGRVLSRTFKVAAENNLNSLLHGSDIICSSVLVKTEWMKRYPFVRSDLHEDLICWAGMMRGGLRAAGLREPLIYYRLRLGSKSYNKMKSAATTMRSYRYLGLSPVKRLFCFIGYAFHGIRRYFL